MARASNARLALALLVGCRAPHPIDPTGPIQATCDDPDAIACVDGLLPVQPYIVAPGRLRVVTESAPRGVALPPSLVAGSSFFIVDITPADRALFAVGLCPYDGDDRSELVALGHRADGWVHVACVSAVLGGEAGHEERWRPVRFDVYEGVVRADGGVVDWRPAVSLPSVADDRQADRLEAHALTVTPNASVLTYELQRIGPKAYQTIATLNAALDRRGGVPLITAAEVVSAPDTSLDRAVSSTLPANLSLAVDDWTIATIRSGDATLARWQLPRASPEQALATCDRTGCAASFVFQSQGTSAIVVKQRHE